MKNILIQFGQALLFFIISFWVSLWIANGLDMLMEYLFEEDILLAFLSLVFWMIFFLLFLEISHIRLKRLWSCNEYTGAINTRKVWCWALLILMIILMVVDAEQRGGIITEYLFEGQDPVWTLVGRFIGGLMVLMGYIWLTARPLARLQNSVIKTT